MTTPTPIICWGHNPGQRAVKDSFTAANGKRKDTAPFPAVVAPWARSDDTGLGGSRTRDLTAIVDGAHYIGGTAAERLPLANRQMANGRLDASSPTYRALVQMSLQHTGLARRTPPRLLIATALPVAWRDDAAEQAFKQHIRAGLTGLADVVDVYVQSEPNAVVGYEMLDDDGEIRPAQAALAKGLVCVGDLGGATLNRSVLDQLRALPGQSASPLLGSRQVVEALMQQSGQTQYVDAERRIETAITQPAADAPAARLLRQYREAVIAELQRAWSSYRPVAYLFAGGTTHWVGDDLRRAFAGARIVEKPQQAIAIGLWRYARRKAARGQQ